ncbi:MAG TPA: 2-hydroxyglutaryl-CoA dehydratase [Bacillota bacterium]|nr:2-hydroxyglutaryl-CoA dehydratase [Bacillota bacterium]
MQSKFQYEDDDRVIFTKEMKKTYTILCPMMMKIQFRIFRDILIKYGYKVELLETEHSAIIDEGLQNVHNDTCYPALLVIGQFLDALKNGKYDINKTALIITQTGGGCRASNYIHLLRKALKKNNLGHVPVISFNASDLEKNPGFKLSLGLIIELAHAIIYGDLLMLLSNQTRPYEINKGDSDKLVKDWSDKICSELSGKAIVRNKKVKQDLVNIVSDFSNIPMKRTEKIKVGIVGEIYMKYAPLGNNDLEEFLLSEGAEIFIPGLLDFILYVVDNGITDTKKYSVKILKGIMSIPVKKYLVKLQNMMIDAVKTCAEFNPPASFDEIKSLVKGYVSSRNKMGEGWLLPAEMLELVSTGYENIVCVQPFGCLPNHIVGKGMIRKIRENHPSANIVAIDYDPGATRINQENRIKLMLSVAKMDQKT